VVNPRSTGEQPGVRHRRRRTAGGRYALAALLTLALHGLFVGLVLLTEVARQHFPSLAAPPPPPRRASQPIGMRKLTVQDWERNRGIKPKAQDQDPTGESEAEAQEEVEVVVKPAKPRDADRFSPGNTVSGVSANDEVPAHADNVAERDNTVAKETTALDKTSNWKNTAPQRTAQEARDGVEGGRATRMSTAGNGGTGNDDQRRGSQQLPGRIELPDARKRDRIALRERAEAAGDGPEVNNQAGSEELQGNSDRLRVVPGPQSGLDVPGGAGRRGAPGLAQLMPSRAAMDEIAGVAPTDHDDDDLEKDDTTQLNTRAWRHAGFINRVKRALSQNWDGTEEYLKRDPTGQIYGGRTRTTVLHVLLNADGSLREAKVLQSSGLGFLDVEAVKAFEKSAPFYNPPTGLADEDGVIHIPMEMTIVGFGAQGPRFSPFRSHN
jgi:TonB family protein